MDANKLLLEVGSEAYNTLTSDERAAILADYTNAQVKYAGMKTFELLMKGFKPSYRMGRMYKDRSAKYEAYRQIYNWYAMQIKAGRISKDVDSDTPYEEIETDRYKFLADTHDT